MIPKNSQAEGVEDWRDVLTIRVHGVCLSLTLFPLPRQLAGNHSWKQITVCFILSHASSSTATSLYSTPPTSIITSPFRLCMPEAEAENWAMDHVRSVELSLFWDLYGNEGEVGNWGRESIAGKREVDGDRTIKEWDDRDFHF